MTSFWNRLDRQIQPAFLGIFAEQRAVRGMDAVITGGSNPEAANSPANNLERDQRALTTRMTTVSAAQETHKPHQKSA